MSPRDENRLEGLVFVKIHICIGLWCCASQGAELPVSISGCIIRCETDHHNTTYLQHHSLIAPPHPLSFRDG